jgi:hypothetical protein
VDQLGGPARPRDPLTLGGHGDPGDEVNLVFKEQQQTHIHPAVCAQRAGWLPLSGWPAGSLSRRIWKNRERSTKRADSRRGRGHPDDNVLCHTDRVGLEPCSSG